MVLLLVPKQKTKNTPRSQYGSSQRPQTQARLEAALLLGFWSWGQTLSKFPTQESIFHVQVVTLTARTKRLPGQASPEHHSDCRYPGYSHILQSPAWKTRKEKIATDPLPQGCSFTYREVIHDKLRVPWTPRETHAL